MSGNDDRSYVHHEENLLEQVVNDLLGVSQDNRGYWEGTDHSTGQTATGGSQAEVDDKLDK